MIAASFWKNKRVLITGHSGFKGSWLSFWLNELGAKVCGISLKPNATPNLFSALDLESKIESHFCDIRDRAGLEKIAADFDPEVVFHMAAQPFVRESYRNPIETYEINVIGTGNVLLALKNCKSTRSIVVVTTDKCYENPERDFAFKETDPLGGYDPYSSSKACTEILTASFRRSFFADLKERPVGLATARAGNAIGGGDWSQDRIIPDVIRNLQSEATITLRNPNATRPWQHVLVPLSGYLLLAEKLWHDPLKYSEAFNFAPHDSDCVSVRDLLSGFEKHLGKQIKWTLDSDSQVHEANFLRLDSTKAQRSLGWRATWNLDQALKATADWYQTFGKNPRDLETLMKNQIQDLLS